MECASIQRDASSIAWCPVSDTSSLTIGYNKECNPLYLLASVHQEMDASFNSTSQIEILNTSPSVINNKYNKTHTVPSLGSCISKLPFTTLTWGQQTKPTSTSPLGMIAGGMEDGSVTFWNPYNMINNNNNNKSNKALIGKYSNYHQQKITAMQFNPSVSQHTFLATADVGEKLYVWDLTNPLKPVAQQPPGGRNTDSVQPTYPKYATAVAWNNNVSYILAVSNCLGQTQIYDLRNKKVALTFESKNIDKAQSISWNPNRARQLAVCYVKGEAEIWDLKQPKSPKMYLRDEQYGHSRPILDLSWNCMDNNLLLTSGDDCIGNIWNGNNGKLIHQISFGQEPKLKVEWNNLRGGILATMSTQNIAIYNINYLGDEYCPKWLQKPCGVDLGFGGKIISFGTEYTISTSVSSSNLRDTSQQTPSSKTKKKVKIPPNINITYLPKSQAMIARAEQFKKTLNLLSTETKLRAFTETKLQTLHSMKSKIIDDSNLIKKQQIDNININDDEHDSDKDILSSLGISDSDNDDDEDQQEMKEKQQKQQQQQQQQLQSNNISKTEIEFEIKIWEMIQLFFNEGNCKDDIIQYLGFQKKDLIQKQQEIEEKMKTNLSIDTTNNNNNNNLFDSDADDGGFEIGNNNKIETGDGIKDEFDENDESESEIDDDDFFNNLGVGDSIKPVLKEENKKSVINKEEEEEEEKERKDESSTDQQIIIKKKSEKIEKRFIMPSKIDNDVGNAIITGNYGLAINLSLSAGNIADALVFAYYAEDKSLWDIVTKSYFNQHSQQFIANTFCYIAKNDYNKLVQTSDVKKWRQTLAILLTFTDGDEFNELCNNLGQRIIEREDNLEGAIACFLCSHNISQLISIWTIQENNNKKPTDLVLYSCITKALIYVNTPYIQKSLSSSNISYNTGQSALSSIFCKYANLLANQGSIEVASTFLKFVDEKLKKPKGRNANDPQIKSLISRINTSQKRGTQSQQQQIYNAAPHHIAPKPIKRTKIGGTRRRNILSKNNNNKNNNINRSTSGTGPTKPPPIRRRRRGPRGGPSMRGAPSIRGGPSMRGGSSSGGNIQSQTQRNPSNVYGNADTSSSPPTSASGSSSMPNRNRGSGISRGRGTRGGNRGNRGGRGGRGGRGAGHTSSGPPINRRQPPPTTTAPTGGNINRRSSGNGMNGTTAMPTRNISRGGATRGSGPIRGGISSRGSKRGRGGSRMPPTTNNRAPQQIQQQQQQQQQQMKRQQHQQQQEQVTSMPPRGIRDRGRGRISPRGGRGGRGGTHRRPQQQQQQQQRVEQQGLNEDDGVIEKHVGNNMYSASATSSGTGFFGQTSLLDDDKEIAPLPDNAGDTLLLIEGYINNIIQDDNIMNTLSITQSKTLKTQSNKLSKDLNDLILGNKMSYYAYSSLLEIFNALKGHQYDNALRQITEFIASCKSNKQEKFAMHRKWVMAFQSIIRITKQYNI